MENQQEEYISYKIDTKRTFKVYKNEYNGNVYYKVQVKKKNYDGTETNFYKQLKFVKCTPPENGEIIRIKKGFEDLYVNNVDKYNPISVVIVMEYEKQDNPIVQQQQAIDAFNTIMKDQDNEITVDDDMLPF